MQKQHRLMRRLIRQIILESNGTTGYKMIFLAGLPGSGKSTLLKQLAIDNKFTNCNIDNFYEPLLQDFGTLDINTATQEYIKLKDKRKEALESGTELSPSEQKELGRLKNIVSGAGTLFNDAINSFKDQVGEVCEIGSNFIVDGTAVNVKNTKRDKAKYEQMGYDCAMIFVDIDVDTSIQRNEERGKKGGRSIWSDIIKNSGKRMAAAGNIDVYENMFDENFFLVSNRGSFEEYQDAIEAIRPGIQRFMGS